MQNPASFNEDWFGMALFYVLPSTVRYHECNLILDNTISDTKTIKSSFSFGKSVMFQHFDSYYEAFYFSFSFKAA